MRTEIIFVMSALILLPTLVIAQQNIVDEKESEVTILPTAKVTCATTGSGKYTATMEGSAENIFSIEVLDCQYRKNEAGVSLVKSEILLDFVETADIQYCQSLRLAQLLELRTANADFAWSAQRVIVDELMVENLYESVKDISLFRIHDKLAGSKISIRSILAGDKLGPSYHNLFWGEVVVFEEPDGAIFSRLLNEKLPEKGKMMGQPDYELKLSLKVFMPRGICLYKEEVDEGGKKVVKTLTKPLNFKVDGNN